MSAALPVHRRLMRALLEAHLVERGVELRVLGSQGLPQAVEGLAQAVHLAFFSGDGKA